MIVNKRNEYGHYSTVGVSTSTEINYLNKTTSLKRPITEAEEMSDPLESVRDKLIKVKECADIVCKKMPEQQTIELPKRIVEATKKLDYLHNQIQAQTTSAWNNDDDLELYGWR
jgi:hypothetical protein